MSEKKRKTLFEKIEGEIIDEAEDYLNYKTQKVKKKAIKIGEISLFVILGFLMIIFGLAEVLATFVPILSGGFSYLVLGIVFLIVSASIKL